VGFGALALVCSFGAFCLGALGFLVVHKERRKEMKELFYSMSESLADACLVVSVISLSGLCLSVVFRVAGWLLGWVEGWK